jgi:hypothetical protein
MSNILYNDFGYELVLTDIETVLKEIEHNTAILLPVIDGLTAGTGARVYDFGSVAVMSYHFFPDEENTPATLSVLKGELLERYNNGDTHATIIACNVFMYTAGVYHIEGYYENSNSGETDTVSFVLDVERIRKTVLTESFKLEASCAV